MTTTTDLAAIIDTASLSEARLKTLTTASAEGMSADDLKKLAEAIRVCSAADGITLPAGRYENLSRGRGWCRLGTGAKAQWAERVDGGYRATETCRWVVGSTDGFSRKDSTSWMVGKVGRYWIAS